MVEHEQPTSAVPQRLTSVDAYRGFVMFLMMAEALHFAAVARANPGSEFWAFLARQQSHVEWIGCTLHDMIQPSFSFLVGVALPYSIASRLAREQSTRSMYLHALWRAFALSALGILLRSVGRSETNYTFEDTLTQIGLGYFFLFWLGLRSTRVQWLAVVLILVGYWAAFALYTPPTGHDVTKLGVPADWPHLKGLAAHWDKNANLSTAFDQWFLNLFPRKAPFTHNGGGYATLSFIPTLATMTLGLIAGGMLKNGPKLPTWNQAGHLVARGLPLLLAGVALGELGICPVVKRIWTPSWVLYSGGICFLMLAAFYAVIDVLGLRRWAFPLVVIGMNSIAAYLLAHLVERFISATLRTHLGSQIFHAFGDTYVPLVEGAAVLLVLWLILFWMYRRRLFLKV